MKTAQVRLKGDGLLAAKVGAGMLGPLLPALALLNWLGDRSFVAVLAVSLGGVLAGLAPIPFVVAWRLSQRRLELAGGRLRVACHNSVLDIGIEELEGFHPIALDDRWGLLGFKVRGTWQFEDPRIFDKAGVNALVDAVWAARPDLAASEATPPKAPDAVS